MTSKKHKTFINLHQALKLAMNNLRPHGDNCFLHDEGEYSACFCGKNALVDYLQNIVESESNAMQPDFSDQATIAGLEASIGHLSALINEQLLLLEEVNENLGVDGLGAELDDDQSPTIAKVRAHLAAMAPPSRAVKMEFMDKTICGWCDGSGEVDSGGTYPWGAAINIACRCSQE